MREALDVELGDAVNGERVTGWFKDGDGRMVILHGNRWHTYSRHERVVDDSERNDA